jgi:hypothetical protein
LTHTYSESGTYLISFYADAATCIGTGSINNFICSVTQKIQTSYISNGKGTTPQKQIISLLGNGDANITIHVCACENNLRFVSWLYYYGETNGSYLNCGSLKAIGRISPSTVGTAGRLYGNYDFSGCASLKRAQVTQTSLNMFDYCTDLKEVEFIGTGSLACNEMNVRFSMLMTKTTPPKITAASPVWGTKPIYVPDEAVDAYKTASGWSDAAAYIFPASEYPDV